VAKKKVKKKDPEAEQQTTSGDLNNPAGYRSYYAPGDWIVYYPDGSREAWGATEFDAQFENA
jgi:hypothetical protein